MERKKLNVDETIYDLKVFSNLEIEEAKKQGAEKAVLLATLTLELIQTLQDEKEEIKNEYVKLDLECQKLQAENAELKNPKFANWKVKFFKAQKEIERLTEIRNSFRQEVITLNNEKLELQKQVDDWRERAKIDLKNEKNWGKIQTKQARKETAEKFAEKLKLLVAERNCNEDYDWEDVQVDGQIFIECVDEIAKGIIGEKE